MEVIVSISTHAHVALATYIDTLTHAYALTMIDTAYVATYHESTFYVR